MSDRQYDRRLITRSTKACKRCGSTDIAWKKSSKGKWYLVEVFTDPRDGQDIGSYLDFHSHYCGKPELHNEEQGKLTQAFQAEQERRVEEHVRQETDRIMREAKMMQDFSAMSVPEREKLIQSLNKKIDRHNENYVSMDFMVENGKWRAESAALQAELDFYTELADDLKGGS